MIQGLNELERLDAAAQAELARSYVLRLRVTMTFLTAFAIVLALSSEASAGETFTVWIMAAGAVVSCIALWTGWWYALHVSAIFFLATFIGSFLYHREFQTPLGSASLFVGALFLFNTGVGLWTLGKSFAAVSYKEFERERAQVKAWLSVMTGGSVVQKTLELQAGSFGEGYSTYVLLNTGRFWVIAQFRNKLKNRLLEYRVLDLCEPRAVQQPSGKFDIWFGSYKVRLAELSADHRESFLGLARRPTA